MLWITLIWLWNGAILSIYEHVTHFVPNIRHKACDKFIKLCNMLPLYLHILYLFVCLFICLLFYVCGFVFMYKFMIIWKDEKSKILSYRILDYSLKTMFIH